MGGYGGRTVYTVGGGRLYKKRVIHSRGLYKKGLYTVGGYTIHSRGAIQEGVIHSRGAIHTRRRYAQ